MPVSTASWRAPIDAKNHGNEALPDDRVVR